MEDKEKEKRKGKEPRKLAFEDKSGEEKNKKSETHIQECMTGSKGLICASV